MTTWQLLTSMWHWHPSVLVGCWTLAVLYAGALGFRWQREAWWFLGGVLLLFITLLGPVHELGEGYLFSAHMLQHLLLMLVVSPLLVLGLPRWLVQQALRQPRIGKIERVIGPPPVAWWLGIGTMWIWHVPVLYNAALHHEGIHIVEHLCFLATSVIFWWPVLAPGAASRLAPLPTIVYLFLGMAASTVLGILLTFVPPGLYPTYLHPHDALGILPLIRTTWGLTPAVDQQLGGLLMWIPGNLVYFAAFIATLVRWFNAPDDELGPPVRSQPAARSTAAEEAS